jgi:hypothetical protein
MADLAHNVPQEYWRPPVGATTDPDAKAPGLVEACDGCETEFMVGARFCHICGAARPTIRAAAAPRPWVRSLVRHLEFHNIKEELGLSTASLVTFLVGLGCVLAAIAVGLIFTAQNLGEWQAIQAWRLEWLLAAATAFIAGILLKK